MNKSDSVIFFQNNSYSSFFTDSISRESELERVLYDCFELGFLTAEYDSFQLDSNTLSVKLNFGKQFTWAELNPGNISEELLSEIGFNEHFYKQKGFFPQAYRKLFEKLIAFCENSGYPFASVNLDSVEVRGTEIFASLNLQKGKLITIDSIEIRGKAKITRSYLYNYLGIHPGDDYNESLIREIDRRLTQVPFIQAARSLQVFFTGNQARIILYLENKNASNFDGILGLAPNNDLNNQKLLLTGELNLKLQNILGTGKSFEFSYRSFLNSSQDLKLKFQYPYILNSSVGADYGFGLFKYDTNYLELNHDIGIQYLLIGSDHIRFFYNTRNTSLITVDTIRIKNTGSLPEFSDLKSRFYGISVRRVRLDYAPNPFRGNALDLSFAVGNKIIVQNPTIRALRISDGNGNSFGLYDSIKLRTIQFRATLRAGKFFPLRKRSTLLTEVQAAYLDAENIFVNELFRIGGIRTLKGFDEQAIWASSYYILNVEYRYLLQQNSNFILFWNGAYYENRSRSQFVADKPYGFGSGINFETRAGIFSIYYAIGKQFNNPIDFRTAKVHFGLINYF